MNVVVDTMPLAKVVDDLVICVRLGKTKIDDVTSLGELLAEYGVRPSGFAIVGYTPLDPKTGEPYPPEEESPEPAGAPAPGMSLYSG